MSSQAIESNPKTTIEVSDRGRRISTPVIDVDGISVVVKGRFVKIASIHDEVWQEKELRDPSAFIDTLRQRGSSGTGPDIFTFAQKLPFTEARYSYPLKWDNVAAARLHDPQAWWEALPQETRKNVRRSAKRGVVTRVAEFDDDLVKGIQGIYNESPIRHGRPFWHYQKDFETVKRDNSSYLERSTFIGSYAGDELIGFMKIVNVGAAAIMMQIVSKMSEFDKRPMNALIAKAVEHSAAQGLSYLVYGQFKYGSEQNSSLTVFKERNGFEELRIPRYYIPLTVRGKVGMSLQLHREIIEIAPHWLLSAFRNYRTLLKASKLSRKPV